jgi:NAD-dependent dihydropyrimidine dehydrogenase PreA subunit
MKLLGFWAEMLLAPALLNSEQGAAMAHVITRKCDGVCDTACVEVCPVDCIHGPVEVEALAAMEPEERQRATVHMQLYIDPAECIGCGACVAECPVDAIYDEDEVPREYRDDIAANELFFKKLGQPATACSRRGR